MANTSRKEFEERFNKAREPETAKELVAAERDEQRKKTAILKSRRLVKEAAEHKAAAKKSAKKARPRRGK